MLDKVFQLFIAGFGMRGEGLGVEGHDLIIYKVLCLTHSALSPSIV